jgi:hypothetical protein
VAGNTASSRSRVAGASAARRPPLVDQCVGGQHPEAAAVAHDRHPVTFDPYAAREDLGGIEQLLQRSHAQHPGAQERGAVDAIGAGERAGVRGDGPGTFRPASGLEHDHRLAPARRARSRHELPRLGHRFHVKQYRRGGGVLREVVEQVAEVDIGHAADRDQVREADPARTSGLCDFCYTAGCEDPEHGKELPF